VAAMMLSEWARVPALGTGAGAFRHGLIEIVEPGVGVVLFAAPGPGYASTCALAEELRGYGATVLIVEHGRSRAVGERAPAPLVGDEFLAPLLDIVPVQLFTAALAVARGAGTSFRHISKVVTQI
jgi:fructoselysine-6-P-deglycase FrlB-like protein